MVKRSSNTNSPLNSAKSAKNDEFYTQMSDIERELWHYKEQFRGKVILCNCDDPRVSNFFRYFFTSFYRLGLKKIISVCYKNLNPDLFSQNKDEQAVYCVYDGKDRADDIIEGDYEEFVRNNEWQTLKGDGDFRSQECIELLKQADIVVTNPPFSLFREYVSQLDEYKKKFLIIGDQNAITYKEIFKLIKDNKLWIGIDNGGTKWFQVPSHYNIQTQTRIKIENGVKYFSKGSIVWFTNLDHVKRHEEITLYKRYTPKEYPKYDNYDAIEVSKVVEIPMDYDGVMGVPVTFLDKYNPKQFEILGSNRGIDQDPNGVYGRGSFLNGKETFKRLFIRRIKK